MEERYHIPLVLCCAEENEVALVRVLDELHKEGRAPEVVAGVDLDVDLLARAVDRTDGPALFVLCQSDELDRAATRRLAGLFSARKAPEHRIVTVQLTPQRPLSILPPIRTALKELLRAQYERDRDNEEDRVLLRDVVGPTPVTAVDRKPPDPEELARRLHKEMLAAEALLDKRGKARTGAARGEEPRGRRAGATATAAARRSTPELAYGGEPGAPRDAMEEESVGMPSLLPALERVPEISLGPKGPDVVQTDFTPTHEKVQRRRPPEDPRPRSVAAPTEEKPGNRVLLFVAIAGITALALMAVLHMSGDDEPRPREAAPAKAEPDAVPAKAAPQTASGRAKTETPPREPPPADKAVEVDPAPAEEPAEVDSASAEAPPPADEEGGDEEPAAVDTRPLVPPPPRTDNEALVIDRAIADGKIRSLDALLVLKTAASEAMTWSEAADHCRGRAVSDIRGWHLPSTAEIKRLRRSRMLGAATYWTRARNEAKDEAYALDNRTGRVNLYLTVERVARPICVRNR